LVQFLWDNGSEASDPVRAAPSKSGSLSGRLSA
jgi:hypothetical protein